MRIRAGRVPVAGAADLALEAAGDRDAGRLCGGRSGAHGEDVRRGVVGKERLLAVGGDGERDVRAVLHSTCAVVLRPALVDRGLDLVVSGGNVRRHRVRAVAVGVLEPGAEAARIPVSAAADLALIAAGGGDDHRVVVAGDPVRLVVVIELDARRGGETERNVAAAGLGVRAVVLVPPAVERGLVFVRPRRNGERPLPDVILGVENEERRGARRVPVAGAAELGLEAPGDGDAGGIGREQTRGGEQEDCGEMRAEREHRLNLHRKRLRKDGSDMLPSL